VILHECLAFYRAFFVLFFISTEVVPHESAAVSARSVYTIQLFSMSLHAKPHSLRKVHECVAENLPPALLAE